VLSRNTQGVRLIRVKEDEALVGIQTVAEPDESEDVHAIALDDEASIDDKNDNPGVNDV
jgi:DNA gyrase subunit A